MIAMELRDLNAAAKEGARGSAPLCALRSLPDPGRGACTVVSWGQAPSAFLQCHRSQYQHHDAMIMELCALNMADTLYGARPALHPCAPSSCPGSKKREQRAHMRNYRCMLFACGCGPAQVHALRDPPVDDPGRLRVHHPLPRPQPVAAQHLPVRHGQAGHGCVPGALEAARSVIISTLDISTMRAWGIAACLILQAWHRSRG